MKPLTEREIDDLKAQPFLSGEFSLSCDGVFFTCLRLGRVDYLKRKFRFEMLVSPANAGNVQNFKTGWSGSELVLHGVAEEILKTLEIRMTGCRLSEVKLEMNEGETETRLKISGRFKAVKFIL